MSSSLLQPDTDQSFSQATLFDAAELTSVHSELEPVCQPGDLWRLGDKHLLLCADCTAPGSLATLLSGEVAKAIVTDPPYETGLNAQECAWDVWPSAIWPGLASEAVTAKDALLAFSIAPHLAHLRVPDVVAAGWDVLETGMWVFGGGRPVNKHRLKRCYEMVYYCSKVKGGTRQVFTQNARGHYPASAITGRTGAVIKKQNTRLGRQFGTLGLNTETIYRRDGQDYFPANVACLPEETEAFGDMGYELIFAVKRSLPVGHAAYKHPTAKPLPLVEQILRLVSNEGDIVLDPFGGGGTTLIACEVLNRRCRMVEASPAYCDLVLHGFETITGIKPKLLTS